MAQASDYPITFPYWATSAPYSSASPHKGEDREMPSGTKVIVNGVQIGLSGSTGYSTGPHLHIGKFTQNGSVLPPNGAGFSFNSAKVVTVSEDATNGKYVRLLCDGSYFVYLHLSQQTCTVGQVLTPPAPAAPAQSNEGVEMITTSDQAAKLYRLLRPNYEATADEINSTAGRRSFAQFVNDAQNEVAARDANLRSQEAHVSELESRTAMLTSMIHDRELALSELGSKLTAAETELAKRQASLPTPPAVVEAPAPAKPAKDYSWFTKFVATMLSLKK